MELRWNNGDSAFDPAALARATFEMAQGEVVIEIP
jgi:hypothetical protein